VVLVDGEGSPFRLTDGAARTVSCAQSLHGLFDTSDFLVVDEEDFGVATVAIVVAERLDDIWL
jgi:hypothetical protein